MAEELSETTDLTLHSDGTSKFNQHYGSFQISAQFANGRVSAYSLGLSEMVTNSAEKRLDALKQILGDIELILHVKNYLLILKILCQIGMLLRRILMNISFANTTRCGVIMV